MVVTLRKLVPEGHALARPETVHELQTMPLRHYCWLICLLQLAVYKPPGLQVVPKADFCQRTLMWLLEQYQQQHRSTMYPDSLLPAPVHRLGRGTSGAWASPSRPHDNACLHAYCWRLQHDRLSCLDEPDHASQDNYRMA
jgi:hypothetical protein